MIKYNSNIDSKNKIRDGINKLADIVKLTLGPSNNTVVIGNSWGASPIVTDDGVTVAKALVLEDKFEELGASLLREIATRTNEVAGDGTTTATVLAQAMVNTAYELTLLKSNKGSEIKAGMHKALAQVVDKLKEKAVQITTKDDIENVAFISSLDKEVSKLIADAFEQVGPDGVITVEEGKGTELEVEVVSGLQFDRGYISPYMAQGTDGSLNNPYILVTDKKLSALNTFIPILEKVASQNKPLLIIAEDVEGDVLVTINVNNARGLFRCVAVKAPEFGQRKTAYLKDIAVLTGATVIDDLIPLEQVELQQLGRAEKVTVTKNQTTIVGGQGDTAAHIEQLKTELQDATEFDKAKLQERIAKLSGGVGVIKVGAFTETEMKAKKFKIEDALNATKAAVEEGVIPGGGLALYNTVISVDATPDEQIGVQVIQEALSAPLKQISENIGTTPDELIEKIKSDSTIVDPLKVTRLALENAVSIAGLLVTSKALIVEEDEKLDTVLKKALKE